MYLDEEPSALPARCGDGGLVLLSTSTEGMGVPGLWQEVAALGAETTLADLAWDAWEPSERRMLRVGIDASLWLFHARKSRGGANPELRALFFRLARLLAMPVTPVFVFDGRARPSQKRDLSIWTGVHAIQTQLAALLDDFGFAHWTAPAEAEAELAWMSADGLIDIVLTEDVDALMFGAHVVVRNRQQRRSTPDDEAEPIDVVTKYDTRQGAWDIDHAGMVLVAALSGGDYDTHGLAACGVKVRACVRQLAHTDSHGPCTRRLRAPTGRCISRCIY